MQEGSITVQLSQSDHWAIKGLQGSWATDLEEFFAGSAIAIKDKTFGNAGFQAQYNSGNPRLYIGDGANAYLKFDGTKLTWKGANSELDVDGDLQCTGGHIGGWIISSTAISALSNHIVINSYYERITIKNSTFGASGIQLSYNSGSPRIYVGDGADEYLSFDGTNLSWKGAYSALSTDGKITCTGGAIGGWTIGATTLANGTNIILDASNKAISINNATFAQAGIQLQYNAGTPRFYVGDGANKWVKFDGTNLQIAEGEIKKVALTDAITLGDGSTISGTITLNIADTHGDCYIAAGKTDFTNVDAGFILGQDDSDSNKAKLYVGDANNYFYWDGSSFVMNISGGSYLTISSGGNLRIDCTWSDPGLLEFVGDDSTIIMTCDDATGNEFSIILNEEATSSLTWFSIGWDSIRWDHIQLYAAINASIYCWYDVNNYARFSVDADSDDSICRIYCVHGGTSKTINAAYSAASLYFYPGSDEEWDLGGASNAWDQAYAYAWNDVGDFFNLDDRDDLATLAGINGSGVIDTRTGLELIDDDTLPEWMLTKDKHTGEILRTPDGKPYVSTKMFLSLLRGGLIQLNQKVEGLINARG